MEGIRKAMNERNLNEGQWEDRKQSSLGVGQRRKTFRNRYIYIYIISTCILCHYTAMSGYHKYVRLKADGLPEPCQTLKYELCFDFCV